MQLVSRPTLTSLDTPMPHLARSADRTGDKVSESLSPARLVSGPLPFPARLLRRAHPCAVRDGINPGIFRRHRLPS